MTKEPEEAIDLEPLASRLALIAIIVLSVGIVPLARLQLGRLGWVILQEDGGAAFWPLAAGAAAGAALLLAYVLWLRRRPTLFPLLGLAPVAVAVAGAVTGMVALDALGRAIPAGQGSRFAFAMERAAASLAAPAWSLLLASVLCSAGATVLAARELARSSTFTVPLKPLLMGVAGLAAINLLGYYLKLGPRPLTAVVFAATLFGPLLLAAAVEEEGPIFADRRDGNLVGCLVLSVAAAFAAAAAESLLQWAAILYSQGPDSTAYARAQALGRPKGQTSRALLSTVVLAGNVATVTVVLLGPVKDALRPVGRRAWIAVGILLGLLLLGIGGGVAHRRAVSSAIAAASRGGASGSTARASATVYTAAAPGERPRLRRR